MPNLTFDHRPAFAVGVEIPHVAAAAAILNELERAQLLLARKIITVLFGSTDPSRSTAVIPTWARPSFKYATPTSLTHPTS